MKCKPWIRHFSPPKFQCFSSQSALHGLRALEKRQNSSKGVKNIFDTFRQFSRGTGLPGPFWGALIPRPPPQNPLQDHLRALPSLYGSVLGVHQSWFSGRGWGQQLFTFQSPAVQWMARTSSLNCLSCRNSYQTPDSLNCLPPFHWKPLLFTEKRFVASPAQKSALSA